MKKTGDQTLIKRINKSLVLDTVIAHAPISRSDIAARLGLNKATVSSLVAEWIDEKLIVETGLGASSGGRKPVMLLFASGAGYAVGIDLGVSSISAVLTDLSGAIVAREKLRLRVTRPEDVVRLLGGVVRSLVSRMPGAAAPYGVVGVGIGVPGIVDDAGLVLTAPNFGWREVALKDMLKEELRDVPQARSLRIVLDNEANAGAVGEKRYGIGKEARDLVYISAGVGLGAGIIISDELYRGASGFSGELGHMTIQADGGRPCSCGGFGCWELYASELALAAEEGGRAELKELESALRLAQEGDQEAAERFRRIGWYLGVGVATAVNAFNPEMVVIGGRLALARDWLEEPLREAAARHALKDHMRRAQIRFASLGPDSAALGAASLAAAGFLSDVKAGTAVRPSESK